MLKNCTRRLIIIILLILFFSLAVCGSSKLDLVSSDGIRWYQELDPAIKYNDSNWSTYTRAINGETKEITVEIRKHPGGEFLFNWKIDKVGNNKHINFYINGSHQVSCNNKEWQYPLGPYLINSTEKIILTLKMDNIKGGRIWIAFPEINPQSNRAPEKLEIISAPKEYYNNINYEFSVRSKDPDGDRVEYIFNWGDGNTSKIGPLKSGEIAYANHSWGLADIYEVGITSLDERGEKSESAQMMNIEVFWLMNVCQGENLTYIFKNLQNNTTILLEEGNYSGPIDIENHYNIRVRSMDTKNKAKIIAITSNYAIGFDNTNRVTVDDLEIHGGIDCIYLRNTNNASITNNDIYFGTYGIRIKNGDNNTIGDNHLEKVGYAVDSSPYGYAGICLNNTRNISIYCNNIIGLSISDGAYPAYKLQNSTWIRFDLLNSNSGIISNDTCLCKFTNGKLGNCRPSINHNHPMDDTCTIINMGVCR